VITPLVSQLVDITSRAGELVLHSILERLVNASQL